jgi:hypothetical protein
MIRQVATPCSSDGPPDSENEGYLGSQLPGARTFGPWRAGAAGNELGLTMTCPTVHHFHVMRPAFSEFGVVIAKFA